MDSYIRPKHFHPSLTEAVNHIHSCVNNASAIYRCSIKSRVQEEIWSAELALIPSRFKSRDVLCISMITNADLDGSIKICARSPLQGIVLGVVTGSRSDLVRSQRPEAVLIQL